MDSLAASARPLAQLSLAFNRARGDTVPYHGKNRSYKVTGLGFISEMNKASCKSQERPAPSTRKLCGVPRGHEGTHRLSSFTIVPFVTRGAILTLWGQKQVPSAS